jgi:hypothetical protein
VIEIGKLGVEVPQNTKDARFFWKRLGRKLRDIILENGAENTKAAAAGGGGRSPKKAWKNESERMEKNTTSVRPFH